MNKLIYTPLAALFLAATASHADLIAYDGFDYTEAVGTEVAGLDGGTGWASAWAASPGNGTLRLGDQSMSFAGQTNIGINSGNLGTDGSTFGPGRASFKGSERIFSAADISSGTLYVSAQWQSFFSADLSGFFRLYKAGVDSGAASLSGGINSGSAFISGGWKDDGSGFGTYSGNVPISGPATTTLVVLKYDYTTDTASLFLNPDPGLPEPAADATLEFTTGVGGLSGVATYFLTDYGTVDEVRVASDWTSAVGGVVEEPEGWYGYAIDEDGYVDTEGWLGWVNVTHDPYIWVMDLGKYVYIVDDSGWAHVFN